MILKTGKCEPAADNTIDHLELNIKARQAGEEVARLLASEVQRFPEIVHQQTLMAVVYRWLRDNMHLMPAAMPQPAETGSIPQPEPEPAPEPEFPEDAAEALLQCETLLRMTEDVPEAGWSFAESVADKVRSISETIEHSKRVTDGQQMALDNMETGVAKWLR